MYLGAGGGEGGPALREAAKAVATVAHSKTAGGQPASPPNRPRCSKRGYQSSSSGRRQVRQRQIPTAAPNNQQQPRTHCPLMPRVHHQARLLAVGKGGQHRVLGQEHRCKLWQEAGGQREEKRGELVWEAAADDVWAATKSAPHPNTIRGTANGTAAWAPQQQHHKQQSHRHCSMHSPTWRVVLLKQKLNRLLPSLLAAATRQGRHGCG